MAVGMTQQDIETGGARLLGALREVECALRALGIGRGNGQRVTIVVPSDDDLTQAGIAATMGWKAACGGTWAAPHGEAFAFYEVGVTSAPRYAAQVLHDNPVVSFETSVRVDDRVVQSRSGGPVWNPPFVCEAGDVTMTDITYRFGWASDSVKGR